MTRRLRRKNQPRRDLVEEGLGGEHTVSVAWIGGRFSEIRTEKDPSVWGLMNDGDNGREWGRRSWQGTGRWGVCIGFLGLPYCHKLCGLNQKKFEALEARSLKPRHLQMMPSPKAPGEDTSLSLLAFVFWVSLGFWNSNPNLCLSSQRLCPLVSLSPIFLDIPYGVSGPLTHDDCILRFPLTTSAKTFITNKFVNSWMSFWGDTIHLITALEVLKRWLILFYVQEKIILIYF